MIDVAVLDTSGKEVERLSVDEATLGGEVRYSLLKQAILMYRANRRQGTAGTKSRGLVAGVNKKLFRQKGTGNARAGAKRTHKRVGGGVAFAKVTRDFSQAMPKRQRRLARDSAVLAKLLGGKVVVVAGLDLEKPHTKTFAGILRNVGVARSCLVATGHSEVNIYKSARNLPRVAVSPVADLNAGQICDHEKMVFTKEAFASFVDRSSGAVVTAPTTAS